MAVLELPRLAFCDAAAWHAWLADQGATSQGIWLKLAKRGSGIESVTLNEAVEAALCHGWIDGQSASLDTQQWLVRFTPRRRGSLWSEINRRRADALIAAGNMRPAGLAAIEAARADGRWEAAYAPASTAVVPDDLIVALAEYPFAQAFFEVLDSTNRYAVLHRIATARQLETRASRIARYVEMLAVGETIYPPRPGRALAVKTQP
jgi:uncharacterized protein YdeI (YjbR/CyaY-like superfamily)